MYRIFNSGFSGLVLTTILIFQTFGVLSQDITPPAISSTFPEDNATGISLAWRNFTINFDESVASNSGEMRLIESISGDVIKTVNLSTTGYFNSSQTISTNESFLGPSTEYFIEIDNGTYRDSSDNLFEGVNTNSIWSFTTEAVETDPPTSNYFYPANGSSEIGIALSDFSFTLGFDELVTAGNGEFRLKKSSTDEVIATTTFVTSSYYTSQISRSFGNIILENNTSYYLEVDNGAGKDVFGNEFQGISDKNTWTFTTESAESDPPVISYSVPFNNTTDVVISNNYFYFYFDEAVRSVDGGNIQLIKTSSDEIVETIEILPSNSYNDFQSFNLSSGLLETLTEYYFNIDAGTYEDVYGNEFAGIANNNSWTFTTEDAETDPPEIISFSPGSNGMDVPISILFNNFTANFDEEVKPSSGQVSLYKSSNDELIADISISSSSNFSRWQHYYFDNILLETSTEYYLHIEAGTYEDVFGNTFDGISDKTTWSFTTEAPETDLPTVQSLQPVNGGTGISIALNSNQISLYFNEYVARNAGQISLIKTSTGEVIATELVSSSSYYSQYQSVYFSSAILETSTQYHIEIEEGTFQDAYGNDFEGIDDNSVWAFTTQEAETEPPSLTYTYPGNGSNNVSVSRTSTNFNINFDEAVSYVSGELQLVKTSTQEVVSTATLNNAGTQGALHSFWFTHVILEASTQYHVEIDAGTFEDVFGNEFEGINDNTSWTFTTEAPDADPPTISYFTPADNTTEVDVSVNSNTFQISFSETVSTGPGEVRLINTSTSEVINTALTTASTSYSSWQYINFQNQVLDPSTEYHIEIDAGSYQDVFGNDFEGISDETTWSFTTEGPDESAPIAISFTPDHSSINVSIGITYNSFIVNFDESVSYVSGEARLIKTSTDETITTSSFNNYYYQNSFWQYFDFTPELLEVDTDYHIEIDAGTFVDAFGNEFEGINDETTWAFRTQEPEPDAPIVSYLYPSHNTSNLSITRNSFQITFDEIVSYNAGEARLVESSSGNIVENLNVSTWSANRNYQFLNKNQTLLAPSTQYHIEMDQGLFVDVFDNEYAGISDDATWSFTTQDIENDAPEIDYLYPSNGEGNVDVGRTYFNIQYNEEVQIGESGEARLIETETGEVIRTVTAEFYSNYFTNHVNLSFFSPIPLKSGTTYHIEVDEGLFVDAFGNPSTAINNEDIWSFTTEGTESEPPAFVSFFPSNNSNNLDLTQSYFQINFDESVSYVDGDAQMIKASTGEVIKTGVINSWNPNRTFQSITFENGILEASTQYHILVDAGTFEDAFGNLFTGIDNANTWSFTTKEAETTPPEIDQLFPENSQEDVAISRTSFQIRFDEPVSAGLGDIRLINTSTDEVIKTTSPSEYNENQEHQYLYFESGLLEPETLYHLEIDAGVYKDIFGNDFTGILDETTWSFTTETGESVSPNIISSNPSNGTSDAELVLNSLYLEFDEPVTGDQGNVSIVNTSTDIIVQTVKPYSGQYSQYQSVYFGNLVLDPATNYHVEVDQGTYLDVFGNELESISDNTTISFSTKSSDNTSPNLSWTTPSNSEGDVSIRINNYTISFDEPVTIVDGEIRLIKSATDELIGSIEPIDHYGISYSHFFNFDNITLEPSTVYHIEVDAGTYKDLFGNEFEGTSGSTQWSFTTQQAENEAPTILFTEPISAETDVPLARNYFTIYFDEPVQSGVGEARIVNSSTSEIIKSVEVESFGTSQYQGLYFNDDLLDPLTTYHIEIDAGAFKDVFDNDFQGISDATSWNFTTQEAESNPPLVTTYHPANGGIDHSVIDKYFNLEFDEPVSAGTGQIRLIESLSGETIATTIPSNFGKSTYQGFYFDSNDLAIGTDYHIEIDANTYEDVFGNPYAGISESSIWAFTTQAAETNLPVINSFYPNDGSTGISLGSNYFYLSFNEPIRGAGEYIRLIRTSSDLEVASVQALDYGYSDYFSFVFDNDLLLANTDYHIEIDPGAFEDIFGNEFGGISNETTWNFTTEQSETNAPKPAYLYPKNNAEDISVGVTYFQITYNEKVNAESGDIRLVKTSTSEVIKTTSFANQELQEYQYFYFDSDLLEPSTAYHIEIDAGLVRDVFGNESEAILGSEDWSFTTEANEAIAPVADSFWPASGSINVSLGISNFQIYFDEPVSSGTGNINLMNTATGEVVKTTQPVSYQNSQYQGFSFDNSLLDANTSYHLAFDVGTYQDVFGNDFAGIDDETIWSFTTRSSDGNAPILTPQFPKNLQENIPLDITYFQLKFDEMVTAGTGEIRIVKTSDGSIVKTTQPTNYGHSEFQAFSVNNDVLEEETLYHIEIDAGSYLDAFGNNYEGLNDQSVWSFATESTTAPLGESPLSAFSLSSGPNISSVFPEHGSEEVALNVISFNMIFDKQVTVGSGDIWLINKATGDTLKTTQPTDLGNSKVQSFLFNSTPMEASASYYIAMPQGIYEDTDGADFGGITDANTWSFNTSDIASPNVTALFPANGSEDVSAGISEFQLNFDEEVVGGNGNIRLVKSSTGEVVMTTSIDNSEANANQLFSFEGESLESFTSYYLELDETALQDKAGNSFDGISGSNTWSFKTMDSSLPSIISLSPENNSDEISINTLSFEISFDEHVNAKNGIVELIETSTGGIVKTTTTGNLQNSKIFNINFAGVPLNSITGYHLSIASGAYSDIFGNGFEGLSEADTWSFTTKDEDPPVVQSLAPENNATNVSVVQSAFEISFNEKVSSTGSGEIRLIKSATNEVVKTISTTASAVATVTFDFGIDSLSFITQYHIEVDAGTFSDLAGNSYDGFLGSSEWSFTTQAVPKINQTLTFSDIEAKKYGEAAFDLEACADTGLPVTFASSNEEIATILGSTLTIIGAGSVEITASQAGNDTYASVYKSQTLTVSKAALTATFNSTTSTFGQSLPTLSFSYAGFVNGDNESVLDEKPSVSTNLSNLNAGNYDVQVSGGKDDNYEISLTSGQLTVGKADATISLSGLEQIEDGNDKTPVVTTSPVGLNYLITFDGASEPPNTIGEYVIDVIIDELNYKGSQSASMKVSDANEVLSIESDLSVVKPLVYPNPVDDYLFLGSVRSGKVQIHDLSGKSVFNQAIDQAQAIDLKDIETGIYYLVLIDQKNNEYHRTKIFKK